MFQYSDIFFGGLPVKRDGPVGPCHGMAPPETISPPETNSPPGGIFQSGTISPEDVMAQPDRKFGKPIPGSVSMIINHYKASLKRWCNGNGYTFFQWQPRFYDHIIRNEESCRNLANYICNNPKKWQDDKFYGSGQDAAPPSPHLT